ncbi:MAG TPA: VCBS repeat-containing protein, partial [Pirellulaceae bacterium]|nr:VCBS repeat-containing protein [Pirellulaceae bacterium]
SDVANGVYYAEAHTAGTNFLSIEMPLMRIIAFVTIVLAAVCGQSLLAADKFAFRDIELPTKLTVGYAVRLLDMNGDKRLDICVVDSQRILWLENPNWNEHVISEKQTKADNVCFAPADINGDGQLDFVIGADWKPFNTVSGGTIQWITADKTPTAQWRLHPIGEEPTVHRLNFADLDADGQPELIVAPLMGRGTKAPNWSESGVRLLSYKIPKDPIKGPWEPTVLNDDLHVTHNFQVTDFNHDGQPDILIVSFEGVHLLEQSGGHWQRTRIGTGNQETSPNKGASEIKHGKLAEGDYVATIEPWHGTQVVVYTKPNAARVAGKEWLWDRHVIDDELKWGHAVWTANLDSDPEDELIIGVRDDLNEKDPAKRRGLRIYDSSNNGQAWTRQIVDPGSVAIEDAAAGDLNGDGKVDIVAVGRATHNIKLYFNETK